MNVNGKTYASFLLIGIREQHLLRLSWAPFREILRMKGMSALVSATTNLTSRSSPPTSALQV
jgi:hypothetical protein